MSLPAENTKVASIRGNANNIAWPSNQITLGQLREAFGDTPEALRDAVFEIAFHEVEVVRRARTGESIPVDLEAKDGSYENIKKICAEKNMPEYKLFELYQKTPYFVPGPHGAGKRINELKQSVVKSGSAPAL